MVEGRGPGRGAPAAAVAALLVNAFLWGVSWWPFRWLQERGLHPLWSTALIYLAVVTLFVAWRPATLSEFRRQPLLWVLGAAAGLTNVSYNWGVTIGDVVRVVLLFYLMPVWTVLLAWLMLGDRPRPVALARMALALAGVWTVLGTGVGGIPWPHSLPDVLGLLGGLGFAFNNILLRRLGDGPAAPRLIAMFGGGGLVAGLVAIAGTSQGTLPALPPLALPWVAGLALLALSFLASNLGLQYGASRLPAHTTALVMLSEVVFASLSAVVLGAAELSPRTLVGGLLIVAAAAWSAWPER